MSIPALSLSGKVAVITGAKRGIGKASALLFAEAGADIAIASRTVGDGDDSLASVAEEVRALGGKCLPVQADVSQKAEVDNLLKQTVDEFGGIDILLNCAGISTRHTPMQIKEEEWGRIIDTNLKGFLFCAQAAAGQMILQKRGGSIITIASVAALKAPLNRAGYASAKLGSIMLTRQMAKELGPHNIRINAIIAGFTKTEMTRDIWGNPQALQKELANIPLDRWCDPREIALSALWLTSDAASYITGVALPVDGGMTA